ncbi:MAG: nucleotidyl transferase AbiEii/AbiGii toxin family protein [Bacteroidetes bacterium]|nr:nucleotidyl transferase AbiEii/AbiGii toxin family protein [Bacteroidota bacterium]
MTNTSLDISGKLDAEMLEIIEPLISVCARTDVEILLVGAVARDIHFRHVHGMDPDQAPMDVDFEVLVPSRDACDEVMRKITRDGVCTQDDFVGHRVHTPAGIVFDLIPFSEIDEAEGQLSWPPDFDHVMSTIGFKDAFDSALVCRVKAQPPLEIRILSIPGMAVLKLIAWADGDSHRSKHAIDFRLILENYDAVQIDRLFSEEENLIDLVNSEYEMAVAQLLGRDAGKMMTTDTRQAVLDILEEELRVDGPLRLVGDMLADSVQGADYVLAQLTNFRQGIVDASA